MTQKLTRFDDVPLPVAMPEDDLSTGMVETSLVDSVGAAYNYFGSTTRLPRRHVFPHRGIYVGESFVRVTSDGAIRVTSDGSWRVTGLLADLNGKTDSIKAKIGAWGQLWRQRIADGVMTWKWARLLHVEHVETIENANAVSEVQTQFETMDVGWRSENAITSSVSASTAVPTVLPVSNGGSIPVTDAILRVQRTSGTLTTVQVTGVNIDITWTGSVGASETLVIDTGKQTVQIGTTDQYSGFVLNVGHAGNEWLPLAVGLNTLTVTVTGGNATVSVEYFNQWP